MESKETETLRKFGIDIVGLAPWGTHLCQFYETKEDLIDILVPYFVEGLRSNEFCIWVTSPPLEAEEAKKALSKAVPNLDQYMKNRQIEIISYYDWYLLGGRFNADRVLQGWVGKEKDALDRGFEGLRLTGNTFWIERSLWNSFVDYEEAVNSVIGQHRMIAVCTYCLTNCTGTDVLDVMRNHVGTLIKQGDKWYLVEDAMRRKAANGALKLSERRYSALFENMQDGFAYHKALFDEMGRPVDYVFLEVNDAFERLTGLERENILGKTVTQVLPGIEKDPSDWIGVYGRVASTGEPAKFENYAEALRRWYLVSAYSPEKGYFVAMFEDITERKRAEEALRESDRLLSKSQEISHLGSWELDLTKNSLSWSDEVYRIFGLQPQEFGATYEAFLEAVHPDDRVAVDTAYSGSLREGKDGYEIEHRIVRRNTGEIRFVQEKCEHVRDESSRIIRSVGMVQDITERKKAEEELRASEQRWATTLASIGDAVISTDAAGWIMFMNGMAQELTGWTANEASQTPLRKVFKIINEKTRLEVEDPVVKVIAKGTVVGLANHTVLVRRDGTEVSIDDSGAPIRDENGRINGVVLVFRDITERRQMEAEIISAARFPSENPYPVLRIGKDSTILYSNPACHSLLGESACSVGQFAPENWRQLITDVLTSGKVKEIDETHEDSIFSYSFRPIVNSGYVNVYGRDITDRKKAEEALRESEELFRVIAEASPIQFSVSSTSDGTILFANPAYEKAFGYSGGELIGRKAPDLYYDPADRRALIETLKKDGAVHDYEVKVKRNDGTTFWVAASVIPIHFDGKEALLGASFDITERKMLEAKNEEYAKNLERLVEERTRQLRVAAHYSRGLIEASLDPLVTISAEGKITDVNKATELVTGCSRDEIVGTDFCDYFNEPNKAKEGYLRVFEEGFVRDYPLAIRHKSGKITDVLYNATVYRNEAGEIQGVFAAARDFTEHKKVDLMLKDAERLSTIGATAGMVGHDLRNPLQAIEGAVYLAKEELSFLPESVGKQSLKEMLETIEEQSEYMNKIVADLQDFVRPITPQIEEVDIQKVIDGVLSAVDIPENIKVAVFIEEDKAAVDPELFRRVLNNLILNAIQAMANGGRVILKVHGEGDAILFSIIDTGVGIPEDVKPKLFTPLFTTKSKGQGFGLAVCKRVVEAHGGIISFESEVGKGTTFTVRIPRSNKTS